MDNEKFTTVWNAIFSQILCRTEICFTNYNIEDESHLLLFEIAQVKDIIVPTKYYADGKLRDYRKLKNCFYKNIKRIKHPDYRIQLDCTNFILKVIMDNGFQYSDLINTYRSYYKGEL